MSGFLNIRGSRLEESCEKVFLTFLQNSLKNIKNIRDAVFTLKFQAKRSTGFLKRGSSICASKEFRRSFKNTYFAEHRQTATSETFENEDFLLPGFKVLAKSLKNTCKWLHCCSNTAGYRITRAIVCVFGLITILLRFWR